MALTMYKFIIAYKSVYMFYKVQNNSIFILTEYFNLICSYALLLNIESGKK